MKKISIYLVTIILLSIFAGSGINHSKASENRKSKEEIILTNDVWGTVILDDKVEVNNVEFFLSKLEKSQLKPSDLILEGAIKVQIVSRDKRKEMYLTKSWAYDGNVVYVGSETNPIYTILEKYMYSSKQLGIIADHSLSTKICSKDINKYNNKIYKQQFTQALAASSLIKGEMEQIQQLPPEYPYYFIVISFTNNKKLEITLISSDYFVVNDFDKRHFYSNGGQLWNLCISLLGRPSPQSDSINYLFEANSIKAAKWEWDLKARKNYIVRALSEGKKLKDKIPNDLQAQYEIIFLVNGHKIPVEIYKDYYSYQGQFYYLPNVINILERIISAG